MAMTNVIQEHIEIVEGAGGPKDRIAGHRIRVVDVVEWHEKMGLSVDEIVERWPTITRADVHAALAYYWDHHEELEAKMAEDEAYAEEMKRKQGPSLLEQKLKTLRHG
jgi:uncharacterized protein (DUF433 family)